MSHEVNNPKPLVASTDPVVFNERKSRRSAWITRGVIGGFAGLLAIGAAHSMLTSEDNPDKRSQPVIEAANAIAQPFDCQLGSFEKVTAEGDTATYQAVLNLVPRPGVQAAQRAYQDDPSIAWSSPSIVVRGALPGESLQQLAAKPVSMDLQAEGFKQVDPDAGQQTLMLTAQNNLPVGTEAQMIAVRPVMSQDGEHNFETSAPNHCGFLRVTETGFQIIPDVVTAGPQPNTLMLPHNG